MHDGVHYTRGAVFTDSILSSIQGIVKFERRVTARKMDSVLYSSNLLAWTHWYAVYLLLSRV